MSRKNVDFAVSADPEALTTSSSTVPSSGTSRPNLSHEEGKRKLSGHGHAVFSSVRSSYDRRRVQEESTSHVIFPWNRHYKCWWGFTVVAATFTIFIATYQIAFMPGGLKPHADASFILEYILVAIFVIDILINFNLAYYDEKDEIVHDRVSIARNYFRCMFWVDLVGVFPLYLVALAMAGGLGEDTRLTQYLALLRLFKLVRLHRMKQLFDILQYSTKVSLMWLTLTRNFAAALVWTHFAACIFYFISRQDSFDEETTWIGGSISGLNSFERYCTTLYWSVVTFTTVGYGDFSPVSRWILNELWNASLRGAVFLVPSVHWIIHTSTNFQQQIFGIVYMLLNMVIQSWIIGSITLLIVKHDEKTGFYQDTLKTLDKYSNMHGFDKVFHKRLKTQMKLEFNNSEISDESVLKHLPTSLRRKVLRRLYLPTLMNTELMKDVRQQFIDAFMTACTVEIFGPGEDILQRGTITSDLYLLVGGVVQAIPTTDGVGGGMEDMRGYASTVADSEYRSSSAISVRQMKAGDFINEVSFFTESPQIDSFRTMSVCKTLTMTRTAYKMITEDHPGSTGKILANLLEKVEDMARDASAQTDVNLPKSLHKLRAGSMFDDSSHGGEVRRTVASAQNEAALSKIQDLVKMHIAKQQDENTTRFLFAASRNDTATIALMCEQGFDPNSADYDSRTALMVASMKGNVEAVKTILEYHANPNLVDMHGSSALYEAARNGHEETAEVLLQHGGKISMDESLAASTLCQCVFSGDMLTLRRLLRAGIPVNAADYDKRTAAHIASCEGNVVALKVLVEFGADLLATDRWENTVKDEAKKSNSAKLLQYLESIEAKV